MRNTIPWTVAFLLLCGCVTEIEPLDPAPAGRRAEPDDDEPVKREPDPGTYVEVPAKVAYPVHTFFDGEGLLVADVVVIHCSLQPYMGRFVTLCKVSYAPRTEKRSDEPQGEERYWIWAKRRDYENDEGYVVTLTAPEGSRPLETFLPRVTFARRLLPHERDRSAMSPSFEIVATERMEIHFVKAVDPARPSWFQLHAVGTPSPRDRTKRRPATYANTTTQKAVRATELDLRLEIVRRNGRWSTIVQEPEAR